MAIFRASEGNKTPWSGKNKAACDNAHGPRVTVQVGNKVPRRTGGKSRGRDIGHSYCNDCPYTLRSGKSLQAATTSRCLQTLSEVREIGEPAQSANKLQSKHQAYGFASSKYSSAVTHGQDVAR